MIYVVGCLFAFWLFIKMYMENYFIIRGPLRFMIIFLSYIIFSWGTVIWLSFIYILSKFKQHQDKEQDKEKEEHAVYSDGSSCLLK